MDIQVLALPQLYSVVITLISVFILYLILRRYLYGPVTNFLEERKSKIEGDLENAKSQRLKAADLKSDYESKISQMQLKSQEILEGARQRGNEIQDGIVSQAKLDAQALQERAKRDIDREKDKAFEDIKKSTGQMALLIASKIMEENITLDKQRNLIDKFIDEVGSLEWEN